MDTTTLKLKKISKFLTILFIVTMFFASFFLFCAFCYLMINILNIDKEMMKTCIRIFIGLMVFFLCVVVSDVVITQVIENRLNKLK